MVINEFWIYSWGFIGIPDKKVNVLFKEFYQIFSLVMRQLRFNLKEPLWIVSYNNIYQVLTLCILSWLINGYFNCYKPFSL